MYAGRGPSHSSAAPRLAVEKNSPHLFANTKSANLGPPSTALLGQSTYSSTSPFQHTLITVPALFQQQKDQSVWFLGDSLEKQNAHTPTQGEKLHQNLGSRDGRF